MILKDQHHGNIENLNLNSQLLKPYQELLRKNTELFLRQIDQIFSNLPEKMTILSHLNKLFKSKNQIKFSK